MIAISSKPERKQRVRTFFKSHEIAHQWAHQLVPFARSPGNMSFDGPDFKSYGTTIARIVTGAKDEVAFVLDDTTHGHSTSAHQNEARSAIPGGAPVFHVENRFRGGCMISSPAAIVALQHARSLTLFAAGENKLKSRRCDAYLQARACYGTAKAADKFFGTKHCAEFKWIHLRGIDQKIDEARPLDLAKRTRIDAQSKARSDARNVRWATRSAESQEANRIRTEKEAAELAEWNDNKELLIAEWLSGAPVSLRDRHNVPVMLRHNVLSNVRVMETSLGVTVPLADAERAFRFIEIIRHGRGNWHRNGETFAIGDFQLDAVNESGVVAGCHRVSWAEVDRFAGVMGWRQVTIPDLQTT